MYNNLLLLSVHKNGSLHDVTCDAFERKSASFIVNRPYQASFLKEYHSPANAYVCNLIGTSLETFVS